MNARELETQHNLKKWAAIIKECRSSGMKILQWLEINNISKDQYYYWQKKLKETCIDTFERQAATFVELPVKCTLCQGHYDFSFSDFYFIFVCCVEASK